MNAADRPSVTIKRACLIASVTRRTMYNWLEKDKVEYVRTAGGSIRIFTDSIFRPGVVPPAPPKED